MTRPHHYPIFVNLADERILVVGGGDFAERKAQTMLEHCARVIVIAEDATPAMQRWAEQGRIEWRKRPFAESDLEGCRLVFCATPDPALNQLVSSATQLRGIPVNVVDVPDLCSFIVPSILRRGHLSLAISTDGLCPSFSRHLRQELEACIDDAYGQAVDALEEVRAEVYRRFADRDYDTRRRVMERVLSLDVPKLVRERGLHAARAAALDAVCDDAE